MTTNCVEKYHRCFGERERMSKNLIPLGKQGKGEKSDNKVKLIVSIYKMGEIKLSVSVVILLIIGNGHNYHLKVKAARLC